MPYTFDPQIFEAMKPILEAAGSAPKIPVGDALTRRAVYAPLLALMLSSGTFPADVTSKDYHATAFDGYNVLVRWYTKKDAPTTPGPAILYAHGGGMFMCSIDTFHFSIANQVSQTGVP